MAPLPWQEVDPLSFGGNVSVFAQESAYWSNLQENGALMRLCGQLGSASGKSPELVESCIEELCKLCWTETLEVVDCAGMLIAARAEVNRLRQRITSCNLSAMKQLAAKKGSCPENSCQFRAGVPCVYEPLDYLDQEQKELVYSIVWDKIQQLKTDTAPSLLVAELQDFASKCQGLSSEKDDEDAENFREQCEDLKELLAGSEERCEQLRALGFSSEKDDVDEDAENLREQCEDLKDVLAGSEERCEQLRARGERAEAELAETQEALRLAEARLTDVVQELEESRNAEASLRAAYQELHEEHEKELRASESGKAEVAQLQAEIAKCKAMLQEKRSQPQTRRHSTVSSRRQSAVAPPDNLTPSPKLPLLRQRNSLSYSDVGSTLANVQSQEAPGFTMPNRRMQVSSSLPALHRSNAESSSVPSGLLPPVQNGPLASPPRAKRPFL